MDVEQALKLRDINIKLLLREQVDKLGGISEEERAGFLKSLDTIFNEATDDWKAQVIHIVSGDVNRVQRVLDILKVEI